MCSSPTFKSTHLLKSHRWLSFLESTARTLQSYLTIIDRDGVVVCGGMPEVCPECGSPQAPVSKEMCYLAASTEGNVTTLFTTEEGGASVGVRLNQTLVLIAQECPCLQEVDLLPLAERASLARQLLANFICALAEGYAGGKSVVDISTVRRVNHILLSVLAGDHLAAEKAFELLLSAIVALCDANASWLELHGKPSRVLVEGDKEAAAAYLCGGIGNALALKVKNGTTRGRLGVLEPADKRQAAELLPLLAKECAILLDIEHLFELLQVQVTRILGNLASGVLLVNRLGYISYANQAAHRLLGRMNMRLVGCPAQDIAAPWTAVLAAQPNQRVASHGDPLGNEQNRRWVDWQLCPLVQEESIAGWLVLVEDRTEHHRWQETARYAERTAVTDSLVSELAHELRNPLSAARGLLQLMIKRPDSPKIASYAVLMLREIDRVTRLLNEFLCLSRPVDMAIEPLQLHTFLEELEPLLQGEAMSKDATIRFDLRPVPLVNGDPGQITQVVLNLVRNAVEAVSSGGEVVVKLDTSDEWVTMTVCDNGPGLAPEALEDLFDPFFTTKRFGTGLGLSVTQAIVHSHGGRIAVGNLPQGGAEFTVFLPMGTGNAADCGNIEVVLALSDPVARHASEQVLRSAGVLTASTSTLETAIYLAETHKPALVILEQKYHAACERLRHTSPETLLLLIGETDAASGESDTPVACLRSPADHGRLVTMVKALLRKPNGG